MSDIPQINRIGGKLFCLVNGHAVEIRASSLDRKSPRWWSGWIDGRRVTAEVASPRIVAALAAGAVRSDMGVISNPTR